MCIVKSIPEDTQAHNHVSIVCDMEHVTQVRFYARFMLPVGRQVICDLAQSLAVQSLHINTSWLVSVYTDIMLTIM